MRAPRSRVLRGFGSGTAARPRAHERLPGSHVQTCIYMAHACVMAFAPVDAVDAHFRVGGPPPPHKTQQASRTLVATTSRADRRLLHCIAKRFNLLLHVCDGVQVTSRRRTFAMAETDGRKLPPLARSRAREPARALTTTTTGRVVGTLDHASADFCRARTFVATVIQLAWPVSNMFANACIMYCSNI